MEWEDGAWNACWGDVCPPPSLSLPVTPFPEQIKMAHLMSCKGDFSCVLPGSSQSSQQENSILVMKQPARTEKRT